MNKLWSIFDSLMYIAVGAMVCIIVATIALICISIPKAIENDNRFTQACSDSKGQVIRTKGQMICIKQDSILEVR